MKSKDNNLNLIFNMLKNVNKEENKELVKYDFKNAKNILPFILENSENINKIINIIEAKQILYNYKMSYKDVDKDKILDLKKNTILNIKENLNYQSKYIVDLLIKFIEIKEIMNKRRINNGL